eukprot:5163330-Ditylum_brightwellii.AAC.1
MQLYTTGMNILSIDGTPHLDDDGCLQKVYENHHVETNARLFTGWWYKARCGNAEDIDHSTHSRFDIMKIHSHKSMQQL